MNETFKTFLAAVAGGLLTGGVTLAASTMDYFNKDRALDIEMVRISLAILGGERTPETVESRKFAINLLNKYATVGMRPLSDTETEQIVDAQAWREGGTVTALQGWDNQILANIKRQLDVQQDQTQTVLRTLRYWKDAPTVPDIDNPNPKALEDPPATRPAPPSLQVPRTRDQQPNVVPAPYKQPQP